MEGSPVGFGVTPILTRGPEETLAAIVPQRSEVLFGSQPGPLERVCGMLCISGEGLFEAEVAEADGNRTRRGCVATPSYGFEVRGPHQRDNRFRGRVYRKKKRPES